MRYHLMPVRMVMLKKKRFGEDLGKRKYLCTVGGNGN